MAGAVLLTPGMAGFIEGPQLELGVGPGYEQFDGLTDNDPNTINPPPIGPESGVYYDNPVLSRQGPSNRGTPTPLTDQTYTPGPIAFPVGTLQGQPWPARAGVYRAASPTGSGGPGGYTPAVAQGVQFRLGVGQRGPSELGVAQTVALGEITNNPPEPGDLASILAGQG